MRNIPCVILFFLPALFDTTSRAMGGDLRTVLAHVTGVSPLRGSLRAAPIAWSRFTWGCGWAGVSLSAGGVIALQAAKLKGRKWNAYAHCLCWPSFDGGILHRQVLAHFRYRCPLLRDPLANVSLLPVMLFSRNTGLKVPSLYKPHKVTLKTKHLPENL